LSLSGFLARKNLRADRFATACMVLGVALGTATVNVVLALDVNTRRTEAADWTTNPDLTPDMATTVSLVPLPAAKPGQDTAPEPPPRSEDVREETHEDYQVMRSAIRLGSLSAFLVGALIVFFSLAVVIEHRRREVALLRSLGATARQVAAIFVREAAWVGLIGAFLGFLVSIPLTKLAALAGITTTGRSQIESLTFPWVDMLTVSALGGLTALLGVVPPVRKILKLKVPETLRPRFLDEEHARAFGRKSSGIMLLVVPFALLVYGLMRPLFREVLPSLAFFVLEAALVMAALLGLLVLVPDVTRVVGGWLARVFLRGPAAARLLSTSRIRRQGHELAWSVGGVMLVFALLLSLHISTHALKAEVSRFAETALRGNSFIFTQDQRPVPKDVVAALPKRFTVTPYSGRTPWPNQVSAVARADLQAYARAMQRPELIAIAERFDDRGVILSTLLSRRLGLVAGDRLELSSPKGSRTLEVTAVTDAIGFVPLLSTYRNSKTYAIVEAANYPLIEQFAAPSGSALVLTELGQGLGQADEWQPLSDRMRNHPEVYVNFGWHYELKRRRETNSDFLIFDVIILLTSVLAAIGVANQLVLAVHTRRRELALLRVLGMTANQIQTMLLLEGAFVGLLGGTLAVLLGIPLGLGSIAALKLVSAFEVHFALPLHYVLLTVAGAVAIALMASIYPARRAAGVRSAESVHYE
jgi:putative ABC transport system permease protein